jgi:hypothetical protein
VDTVKQGGLYATALSRSATAPWLWRVLAGIAWLVGLALLALTLAHWGWTWFGPEVLPLPTASPDTDPVQRIASARLFGAPGGASSSAAASSPANVTGDLRLLGVFAERDGRGYALFRAGARGPLLVAAGQDVGVGVRLESVRPDGVTLVDGGTRRELALRSSTTMAAKARPASGAVATASPKPAACTPPSGFTGPVVRLNAELLGGMVNAPDGWRGLIEAGSGALIVRDQGGFGRMLGLKTGDRIERANGIALTTPDDIASTVLQPLTQSQQVLVAGTRDGKPQQWLLVNGGACPS